MGRRGACPPGGGAEVRAAVAAGAGQQPCSPQGWVLEGHGESDAPPQPAQSHEISVSTSQPTMSSHVSPLKVRLM
jgi:hypothetical protein